jgi:hypothetical protein
MADGIGSFTFSELHLLPRVVFAIGTALFVAALLGHNITLAARGLGLIFAALAYNFFYDFVLNTETPAPANNPAKFRKERKALIIHGFLSTAAALYSFYVSYSVSHGGVPFPF